jgi:hypothetical protein
MDFKGKGLWCCGLDLSGFGQELVADLWTRWWTFQFRKMLWFILTRLATASCCGRFVAPWSHLPRKWLFTELPHVSHYLCTNTGHPLAIFKHFISFWLFPKHRCRLPASKFTSESPVNTFCLREKLIVAQWRTAGYTAVCVSAGQFK